MPFVSTGIQTDEIELLIPDLEKEVYKREFLKSDSKLAASLYTLNLLKSQRKGWMSRRIKKWLCMLIFITIFGLIGLLYFIYNCTDNKKICSLITFNNVHLSDLKYITEEHLGKPLSYSSRNENLPTFADIVSKDFLFDIEGHDVMVFLHMQKTGGTSFGRHLVSDLEIERECVCHRKVKKRCTCLRPGPNSRETWLFSRYSTGWKCGLHADWTELTSCVDDVMDHIDNNSVKRRYFYITFLRDPVHRYISEFRHVRRGATWKNARLYCKGHSATEKEVPLCYSGEDWSGVSLKDFISCHSNLANNRQTRMLADLSLVDCYNIAGMSSQERDTVMLASAKRNLENMAFFGLTEFQEKSQYIFEETFNLKFNTRFSQHNSTIAENVGKNIKQDLLEEIKQINHLDIQLYEFAKNLLQKRFNLLKDIDPHFADHFKNMGHMQFSWDDIEKEN